MHRCLGIVEIVEQICSDFDTNSSRRLTRKDLAVLARTSSIFYSPALSLLWRTQASLAPLLGCMPSDLFDQPGNKWRLLRPIVAADWAVAKAYAARIKYFEFEQLALAGMHDILPALNLCGFLFPNLTAVEWPALTTSEEFQSIRIFVSPKLTCISFACNPLNENISLLSTLAAECPELTHVSISFGRSPPQVTKATSLFVCALSALQSLSIGNADEAALAHLGRLPTLTSLTLSAMHDPLPLTPALHPMFTHLRHLSLTTDRLAQAANFLRMCSNPALFSLHLEFMENPSVFGTDNLYDAITKHCTHAALTSLDLSFSHAFPLALDSAVLMRSASLRTLRCFANLTSLSITSPIGFDLDDAAAASLAPAWPRMQHFKLATTFGRPPGLVTLSALRTFAQLWPRLQSLHIDLDATHIPVPAFSVLLPAHGQQSLTDLSVGSSPVGAPAGTARFLSALFPRLQRICTDREDEDNESPEALAEDGEEIARHRRWKEVEAHVPEFVAAREEARMWALA